MSTKLERLISIKNGEVLIHLHNDKLQTVADEIYKKYLVNLKNNKFPESAEGFIEYQDHKYSVSANNDNLLTFLQSYANSLKMSFYAVDLGLSYVDIIEGNQYYVPAVLN